MDVENLEPTTVVMVHAGSAIAVGLAAHTAFNLTQLREPQFTGNTITEPVSILIPARNEASTIEAAVRSASNQMGLADLEIIVMDDDSSDETAEIVNRLAQSDPRIRLMRSTENIPAGWMGKQFACHRLSREARGSILVFLDADVTLEPHAVAACSELMRLHGFAMVAPYPRQLASGTVERLVQPLVVWSWAATLPVGIAENSLRPSLSAANGQLLVVDAGKYHAIGGHESVQSVVLEDIALMRELKKSGERCVTVNGSALAQCRMYDTTTDLVEGYAKSLWSAFGSAAGSLAISALLATAYIVPAAGMLTSRKRSTRMVGALGYGAGVLSRGLVAHRTASPVLPDSLAHPASVATFIGLTALSWSRHLRGTNTWKGRTL